MVKMKTGGSVSKAVEESKKCSGGRMKDGGKVHDDVAQDKALIKKEIGKFAKSEDKGEKTELKLKSGGRAKKAQGSVKKFKAGGEIAPKIAAAPSKAKLRPTFKASDVEKEKSKPAGDAVKIIKVKPTGDKKAAASSKATVKSKDVKKFANGGTTGAGGVATQNPIPPSIAAQLMMAARGANLQGANPPTMGTNPLPTDNPVVGSPTPGPIAAGGGIAGRPIIGGRPGMGGGMGGGGAGRPPFNGYQNFLQRNPGRQPQTMSPQEVDQLMRSQAFQNASGNATDR